jgi:hypothetical protein
MLALPLDLPGQFRVALLGLLNLGLLFEQGVYAARPA